jgi:MFS family permease
VSFIFSPAPALTSSSFLSSSCAYTHFFLSCVCVCVSLSLSPPTPHTQTLDRFRGRVLSYDLACGVLGQILGIIVAGLLLQDTMTVYGLMGTVGVIGFSTVLGFLTFFHFGWYLYYVPCCCEQE